MINENPRISCRRIAGELPIELSDGQPIPSRTTIQRYMKSAGFIQEVAKIKPLLRV